VILVEHITGIGLGLLCPMGLVFHMLAAYDKEARPI